MAAEAAKAVVAAADERRRRDPSELAERVHDGALDGLARAPWIPMRPARRLGHQGIYDVRCEQVACGQAKGLGGARDALGGAIAIQDRRASFG